MESAGEEGVLEFDAVRQTMTDISFVESKTTRNK